MNAQAFERIRIHLPLGRLTGARRANACLSEMLKDRLGHNRRRCVRTAQEQHQWRQRMARR
jgi:hypothetical protein